MILDSNIIIYSLLPAYGNLQAYLKARTDSLYASDITKLEVVGFHSISESEKESLNELFSSIANLPVTSAVINEAIRLRQQRKRSLGDAIIAATALIHNLPVVTNNLTDFSTVEGLTVISLDSILAGTA